MRKLSVASDPPSPSTQSAPSTAPSPPLQPSPPRGLLGRLLDVPIWLYRLRLGWLLGTRFVLLTHRGRKTGIVRKVVVECVSFDRRTAESVVMAGWGRKTKWLLNLEAGGGIEVQTGRLRYRPAVRMVEPEEAERIFADYEHRNRFASPVVRRVLSGLLGWRYDGSAAARARAVRQLQMVGLRPAG
jgi:deazaflavin-dependent oxidoreductase (nitroreductase family)